MAATTAQIAQLRRMTGLVASTDYSDATLEAYIETYPLKDERGEEPYTWDTSTSPPHQDTNVEWIATYDLNAAAADVWDERAATVAQDFDFSADGGNYSRSQVAAQYQERARYYRSRRRPATHAAFVSPEVTANRQASWIGNLAEPHDDE